MILNKYSTNIRTKQRGTFCIGSKVPSAYMQSPMKASNRFPSSITNVFFQCLDLQSFESQRRSTCSLSLSTYLPRRRVIHHFNFLTVHKSYAVQTTCHVT